MNLTTRTAAALAVAAVALIAAYGTAHAACRTLAPGQHRATYATSGDGHDPKEDVERDENGGPDLAED
ncbi:hypothetical protein [Streptomyces sp. MMG1121]|uniref:hypothetical protein n=1 Tax=Streptomyces sp. MMG1121 TaxID=1415544 RepID=UPI0006B05DF9|nr:hypothetical protein [Streptomyces sp. MMG1121]KOV69317.1 hypothetical protein ADK64_06390 [Streptomyces sp. MMG1121]